MDSPMKPVHLPSAFRRFSFATAALLAPFLVVPYSTAQAFTDSFESGYSQNWVATTTGSGSIALSTAHPHTGAQAVATSQNGGGNAILKHAFPNGFRGRLGIWHFISSPTKVGVEFNAIDKSGRNYSVESIRADMNQAAVSGQAHGGGTEIDYDVIRWVGSGWHHLEIEISSTGTRGWYDGVALPHVHPTLTNCFWIQLAIGWTSYGTVHWDDFEAIAAGSPAIALSTSDLDFGDTATHLSFDVWNNGGGTLNYSLSDWPAWVTNANPSSATSLNASDRHTHTVTIDRSKLAPGENSRPLTITAAGAANSPLTVQLRAVGLGPTGSLHVNLNPAGAVTSGAMWRRVGTSAWHYSGETEDGIPVGQYQVEFSPANCWTKPANAVANINDGITTLAWGDYTGAIYGKIMFRTRLGEVPPGIEFPASVQIKVWQDQSTQYQWPANEKISANAANPTRANAFDYCVPIPTLPDARYTIGFSVYGSDWKMSRVTVTESVGTTNVLMTYERVDSQLLQPRLLRRSGYLRYGFGILIPFADGEKEAIRRALKTWERTGVVKFFEDPLAPPGWLVDDITFVKLDVWEPFMGNTSSYTYGIGPLWIVDLRLAQNWLTDSRLSYLGGNWFAANGTVDDKEIESVALHEVGHVLGLRYPIDNGNEDSYPDNLGGQWSIMAYSCCNNGQAILWPGWSDVESLKRIAKSVLFRVACPVDLILTDPNGLTTTRTNAGIPTSQYYETNYVSELDGTTNHIAGVIIDEPVGTNYQVTVIPRSEAQTNDTFSLTVQGGNGEVPITADLPLTVNPTNGFTVYAEPGLVQFDHCVFAEPLDLADLYLLSGTQLPIAFSLANCTNSPITEMRDLLMEITGPGAGGTPFTNIYCLTNGTLAFASTAAPPAYTAAFDTATNSLRVNEPYFLAIKQYGAPIGSATITISTNRDSRLNLREYAIQSGHMNLRWGNFPGQVFIESSTNLTSWETAAGPLSTNRWTSSTPATEPTRFYRVRSP